MLPLVIKIEGLYSYIEEQTIDFTELTNSGLFGIFGEIGSGKSSILDVMCFAIYKQTERLNVSGDNRYYNMMNLKCNKAIASFKFQAGAQNTIYETQFSLNRNRNNFEDVSLANHSFFRVEGLNMIPITQSEVLTAVGISYDNFKRTIIIPQGKFKDFIELGDTDRTKMMKELFNLHRFDLSTKVSVLEKNNTEELNNLKGKLSTFELISKEQVESLEKELKVLIDKFNQLTNESKTQTKLVKELGDLKNWFDQITKKRTSLEDFQIQESKDQKREAELQEYEKVADTFKNLLTEITQLKLNLEKNKTSINELNQLKDICGKQLDKCDSDLNTVTEKKSKIDTEKEKINDFESLIHLKSELKTFSDIKIKTTLSSDSLKLTTDTIENLNSQKRALQQNNLEIEKGLVSESKLTEINFWFENLNGFKNSEEDNVAKKIVIQEELGRFTQEFEMVFQSEIKEYFKSLNKGYSIVEFNITITQISNNLSKKLKEKRAELTHLKVQEELVKFSTNLEEGTPCDLCGSIHHPNPLSKEFSMSHLHAIEKEIEAVDDTEITLNELVQSIRFLFVKQENKQKELLLNKEELEKFQNLKNLHIQKVPDVAFNENDKEKFKVYFELATKQHNQLNQDRKQITSIEEEIQQKQDVKDVIQTELNQLYVAIASVEAKILMYRQGLKQLKEVDFIIVSIEELIKNKEILKQEITNIEEDFKRLSTQSQELKVKLAEISVKIKMNIADGEKTKESLLDKNTQFISKLEGFKKTASEIESILSFNLNAQEIRNFIEENRKKFNMLQGEIKTLENQINSREFNEAQFREEQEKLSAISAELIVLIQNKGRIESGIKETTIKLKEKKDLQRMYAEIELRSGNLKTLRRMFMSNGFVNFMSIRYLHNIVELANVRFQKMTKQQFKLTLKGKDNAFYVVDFLNGGKERSIKSLGGGQTFQACLALALALSENIQKLASIDQQFFFLDEGFGTLDKNAIELVFDTLKSLKNENRVVGLISHVEELQQEMDVFLKITNDAITGTVITESWK